MALVDLFVPATLAEIKAKVAQFAGTAKLILTSWYSGSPGEQLYQAFAQSLAFYTGTNAKIIRGFFLDLATDPGDFDAHDPGNEALEPAYGFLSALGEQCFFTTRPGATFATTVLTFANTSNVAQTFVPGGATVAILGHPEVTYTNDADPSLYAGPGGTYTLAAGATGIEIAFTATEAGSDFSAAPGELSVLVSGWPGVTVTNAGAALGTDRMEINAYRALCRTQAAATSPNGAPDAYLRLSRLNLDGTPLLNASGAAVGITKVYVSQGSATSIVNVFYADDDGAASAEDVTAANENIILNVIAVPDCITFTGAAAVETSITVTWVVKYRSKYLGATIVGADVKAAIVAALTARFVEYEIGGFDQTAGAGTIYANDVRGVVERAHPAIYSATVSSPAGDTVIALGHVAHLVSPTGTETAG